MLLVDAKYFRTAIFSNFLGTRCYALCMVEGKEPTGDMFEDMKHIRAVSVVMNTQVSVGTQHRLLTLLNSARWSRCAGYGAKYWQNGNYDDELYAQVFPVSIYQEERSLSYSGNTIFGLMRMLSGYYPRNSMERENVAGFVSPEGNAIKMIADYGEEFDFRRYVFASFGSVNFNTFQIEYSLDKITWTALPLSAIRENNVNFRARYFRYSQTGTAAKSFTILWSALYKEDAFVPETIDKVVFTSLGSLGASSVPNRLDANNYIGLTLDVDTDITLSHKTTGTGEAPVIISAQLKMDSYLWEGN